MKKIVEKFIGKIMIPLISFILLLCLPTIFEIRVDGLMHKIIIAMGSCSLLWVLFGCASFIKWMFYSYKIKNRLSAFATNADGSYTCPVCRMDNMDSSPCERCGFDPLAKKKTSK